MDNQKKQNLGGLSIKPIPNEHKEVNHKDDFQKSPTGGPKKSAEQIVIDIADVLQKQKADRMKREKASASVLSDLYQRFNDFLVTHSRVKLKDKVTFFQLLSVMLNAGVPLVKSLAVLGEQFENAGFKKTIREMAVQVDRGGSLSEVMADYPRIFAGVQIGMVEAAEVSGQMNEILHDLAIEMEKAQSITNKIKGAMTYPIAVLCVLAAAGIGVMIFVVPKLTEIFIGQGMDLPLPTRILIGTSDFFIKNGVLALIIFVGLFMFMGWWKRTENGKYYWDKILLHLPIFGNLVQKISLSRFTHTLANLMKSGIPIVKALSINAEAIGNEVYRRRILEASEDVQQGIPLGENLSDNRKLFPPTLVHMIIVGEQTAQLDTVANKIANFYDEEIDTSVKSMSKLMEPLIMIIVGAGVALMVAAIMLPIFEMADLSSLM